MISVQITRELSSEEENEQPNTKPNSQAKESRKGRICDFCGEELSVTGLGGKDRRKYCSKSCQGRASQGRVKARMAKPPSKRRMSSLKYSSPLYFN